MQKSNKQTISGLLSICLGALGAHYFYLGNTKKGVTYVLISLLTLGVGLIVLWVKGIVDGVKIMNMSPEAFACAYGVEVEEENKEINFDDI